MVSLAHDRMPPEPPKTANPGAAHRITQCSTCGIILNGQHAGQKFKRWEHAAHTLCFDCYMRQQRAALKRWPDIQVVPYKATNRHVRPLIPIPSTMFDGDLSLLAPGVLRVYGEIFQRGADREWIAASLSELAAALGYSRYHVHTALERLCPQYIEVRRESPRAVPAFRIVRPL